MSTSPGCLVKVTEKRCTLWRKTPRTPRRIYGNFSWRRSFAARLCAPNTKTGQSKYIYICICTYASSSKKNRARSVLHIHNHAHLPSIEIPCQVPDSFDNHGCDWKYVLGIFYSWEERRGQNFEREIPLQQADAYLGHPPWKTPNPDPDSWKCEELFNRLLGGKTCAFWLPAPSLHCHHRRRLRAWGEQPATCAPKQAF